MSFCILYPRKRWPKPAEVSFLQAIIFIITHFFPSFLEIYLPKPFCSFFSYLHRIFLPFSSSLESGSTYNAITFSSCKEIKADPLALQILLPLLFSQWHEKTPTCFQNTKDGIIYFHPEHSPWALWVLRLESSSTNCQETLLPKNKQKTQSFNILIDTCLAGDKYISDNEIHRRLKMVFCKKQEFSNHF